MEKFRIIYSRISPTEFLTSEASQMRPTLVELVIVMEAISPLYKALILKMIISAGKEELNHVTKTVSFRSLKKRQPKKLENLKK